MSTSLYVDRTFSSWSLGPGPAAVEARWAAHWKQQRTISQQAQAQLSDPYGGRPYFGRTFAELLAEERAAARQEATR